ncbi:MAG: TasA family protein, partial [Haloarculaceae archaeon]
MTDDSTTRGASTKPPASRGPNLTRRQVLATGGFAGGLSALGGGRTVAYLSDFDRARNRFAAGALDLTLCWEPAGSSETCEPTKSDSLGL